MSESMGGGGIGEGNMQEAGRKMQAHVDESEARRKKGSHGKPPDTGRSRQLLLGLLLVVLVILGAVFLFTRSDDLSPLEVCRANGDEYAGANTCCKPGASLAGPDCYRAVE